MASSTTTKTGTATTTLDVHLTAEQAEAALRADALAGLTATPKVLRPQWLYDARGSELFERITALPEYYPFVAERDALAEHAGEITRSARADTLVELGSGSSTKTPVLLDAMHRAGLLRRYIPVDVSAAALEDAVPGLVEGYPELEVTGVVGDFTHDLRSIPHSGRRMVCLLGGTLGNFEPAARHEFLAALGAALEPGETFLVGADLVKDPDTLVRAYDDSQGVTAEFERNALRVLNRTLDADFDEAGFDYVAEWVPEAGRIEMGLRAVREMDVRVGGLDLDLHFAAGERMRTEISTKFTRDGLAAELSAAGFGLERWCLDPGERFALALATRG